MRLSPSGSAKAPLTVTMPLPLVACAAASESAGACRMSKEKSYQATGVTGSLLRISTGMRSQRRLNCAVSTVTTNCPEAPGVTVLATGVRVVPGTASGASGATRILSTYHPSRSVLSSAP